MRDRLIELIDNCSIYYDGSFNKEIADHLIANGVIVMPCKAGDIVYMVKDSEIVPAEILSITSSNNGTMVFCQTRINNRYGCAWWNIEDFGKTVFSDYEDAEKALGVK